MPTVKAKAHDDAGWKPRSIHAAVSLEPQLAQHRAPLTAFCRRMVGSSEAEDAVQETLVRAWRGFDRFEGRVALQSWLFRIAFNVCLDCLRARQRRARRLPIMGPDLTRGAATSQGHPRAVAAIPTAAVDGALSNPAETAVTREAVGLALATLMRLPPRQRGVLILRDVLRWKAVEVAELLDTTVASVNSALQRARSMLATRKPSPADLRPPDDVTEREVLARYVDAFERYDLEVLCSLVREDARRAPGASRKEAGNAVVRGAGPVHLSGAAHTQS